MSVEDSGWSARVRALGLSDRAEQHLKERWLDQLEWFERKAGVNQRQHRRLRIVSLVGGVIAPVLVNVAAGGALYARIAAIAVSVVVGVTLAVDGFLRPGDRWLQYRRSAEGLQTEYWLYANSAGPYRDEPSMEEGHRLFVERVEAIIAGDVQGFVAIASPAVNAKGTGT
jgi:hypothetical protein